MPHRILQQKRRCQQKPETNTELNPLVKGYEIYKTLDACDVTNRIRAVLQMIPAKVLCRAAGSSERAAENAKQGINSMSLAHFLNACRKIPELREVAMELMGCPTICSEDIDPEFIRGFEILKECFAKAEKKHAGRGKP
jgi:hypothetical protein